MYRRIVPFVSALMVLGACDSGKTEAKKAEPDKASDAKVVGDKATAPPDKADPAPSAEDAELAKKAEEKKAEMAKAYAELEQWATREKARWTDEIETGIKKLTESKPKNAKQAIAAVVASPHRNPENVERDKYRHPEETLAFIGLEPSMTVIEIGPGRGWYTELLAPVLANQGKLVVTDYDPAGDDQQTSTLYARRFDAFLKRSDSAFGKVERIVQTDPKSLDLGPDGTADLIFVARGIHGWVNREVFDDNLKKVHAALKPNGIVGIVQHRAKDGADPEKSAKQGYLPQAWVVEQFEGAGFALEEASEVNANPSDTTDYPEGVWTLPPTLALEDKDRDRYVEIGESDRMTLRFRKK